MSELKVNISTNHLANDFPEVKIRDSRYEWGRYKFIPNLEIEIEDVGTFYFKDHHTIRQIHAFISAFLADIDSPIK